jgi:3-oxoacyl-[acyl-carrier-protein] synthase II
MRAALISWAWHTPLGSTDDPVVQRLMQGHCAAAPNRHFDATAFACTLAAAIPRAPQPSRQQRYLRRMGLLAVEVAVQAWQRAGLQSGSRVGLFFGYGGLRAHWADLMPAFENQYADGEDAWSRGLHLLHPFWMLQHLSNNAHAIAAQAVQARGEGSTYAGANAGAQALNGAICALHAGAVDAAVVVGYDSLIEPEIVLELGQKNLLSRALVGGQVFAPYQTDAAGFIPGEAAAAVVLERPAAQCAPLSYVQAQDGAGALPLVRLAQLARRLGQEGDVVDGLGWADVGTDLAERDATGQVVGTEASLVCLSSAMGHMGAATSVVQAIALTQLLQAGCLPPIAGCFSALASFAPMGEGHQVAPLCPVHQAQSTSLRAALGLSMGAPGLVGAVRVELP